MNNMIDTNPAARFTPGTAQVQNNRNGERDQFMQLLLLQLRSQDPMSPMDTTAMFNQMSQLSMLEQLWDIRSMMEQSSATQQLAQGSNLLGRHVQANTVDHGMISGLVDQVRMVSGQVWLQIGNREVKLDQVVTVQ